ncbi:hypothetical protein [Streptomyces sp. BK79]|uniref:hypothetical protein n=1 Tax=Streptomyces sp. BK79 TaxID=3350097 RepID=UPI00376FE03B
MTSRRWRPTSWPVSSSRGVRVASSPDRKLLTGDSPLASHKLGLLAAEALVVAAGTAG